MGYGSLDRAAPLTIVRYELAIINVPRSLGFKLSRYIKCRILTINALITPLEWIFHYVTYDIAVAEWLTI